MPCVQHRRCRRHVIGGWLYNTTLSLTFVHLNVLNVKLPHYRVGRCVLLHCLHRTDETRGRSRSSRIYTFDYRTLLNKALVSAARTLLSNLYITGLEALLNITNANCWVRTTHTKDDREPVYVMRLDALNHSGSTTQHQRQLRHEYMSYRTRVRCYPHL